MRVRLIALACLLPLLAACSNLLPRGRTDVPRPFDSFQDAATATERIVPFETRAAQLPALGFDASHGSNVRTVPYPDIVTLLAPYSAVAMNQVDPGIAKCIEARTGCRGYVFHFQREDRKREGSFLLDILRFRRETHTTGWWLEALVVVDANDTVLFRNVTGRPRLGRVETQVNPLGFLQDFGESVGPILLDY
jgi:hypothetical protein